MLSLVDRLPQRTCAGLGRREFLTIGGLGLGSLAIPQLATELIEAAEAKTFVREKAVVLLFLAGGPPQHETFDPKMSAPSGVRSTSGEVETSLAGVTFGGDFPQMAQRAHRLAVVRSYGSDSPTRPAVRRPPIGTRHGT